MATLFEKIHVTRIAAYALENQCVLRLGRVSLRVASKLKESISASACGLRRYESFAAHRGVLDFWVIQRQQGEKGSKQDIRHPADENFFERVSHLNSGLRTYLHFF